MWAVSQPSLGCTTYLSISVWVTLRSSCSGPRPTTTSSRRWLSAEESWQRQLSTCRHISATLKQCCINTTTSWGQTPAARPNPNDEAYYFLILAQNHHCVNVNQPSYILNPIKYLTNIWPLSSTPSSKLSTPTRSLWEKKATRAKKSSIRCSRC